MFPTLASLVLCIALTRLLTEGLKDPPGNRFYGTSFTVFVQVRKWMGNRVMVNVFPGGQTAVYIFTSDWASVFSRNYRSTVEGQVESYDEFIIRPVAQAMVAYRITSKNGEPVSVTFAMRCRDPQYYISQVEPDMFFYKKFSFTLGLGEQGVIFISFERITRDITIEPDMGIMKTTSRLRSKTMDMRNPVIYTMELATRNPRAMPYTISWTSKFRAFMIVPMRPQSQSDKHYILGLQKIEGAYLFSLMVTSLGHEGTLQCLSNEKLKNESHCDGQTSFNWTTEHSIFEFKFRPGLEKFLAVVMSVVGSDILLEIKTQANTHIQVPACENFNTKASTYTISASAAHINGSLTQAFLITEAHEVARSCRFDGKSLTEGELNPSRIDMMQFEMFMWNVENVDGQYYHQFVSHGGGKYSFYILVWGFLSASGARSSFLAFPENTKHECSFYQPKPAPSTTWPPQINVVHVQCVSNLTFPGDEYDNDCDGKTDEEIENYLDDDLDGLVDEDLQAEPPVDGAWGRWGNWTCAVTDCENKGQLQRKRYCHDPIPLHDGNDCNGSSYEVKSEACQPQGECYLNCPDGYFGWGCSNKCPDTCEGGVCTKLYGECETCKAGYIFSKKCRLECNLRYYGKNCSHVCPRKCIDSCDYATGKCLLPGRALKSINNVTRSIIPIVISSMFLLCCIGGMVYNKRLPQLKEVRSQAGRTRQDLVRPGGHSGMRYTLTRSKHDRQHKPRGYIKKAKGAGSQPNNYNNDEDAEAETESASASASASGYETASKQSSPPIHSATSPHLVTVPK